MFPDIDEQDGGAVEALELAPVIQGIGELVPGHACDGYNGCTGC